MNNFSSKLLSNKKNLNKNDTIYIVVNKKKNNKTNSNIPNSLTEINQNNNYKIKGRNKSRNIKMNLYNNEQDYLSYDLAQKHSRKFYTININKYQN